MTLSTISVCKLDSELDMQPVVLLEELDGYVSINFIIQGFHHASVSIVIKEVEFSLLFHIQCTRYNIVQS